MTTALQAITYKAQTHPGHVFQNLSALLEEDLLYESWGQLKKNVAPGIDGVDAQTYSEELSTHITTLTDKLKRGAYRANRIKRVYIDKASGGQRPLGLPTLEDKLVQQSVAQILSGIYEADFLPNSYGYRPKRSAHGAIHSLRVNLQFQGFGYLVEADIKGFFDTVNHSWLQRMLKQRIDDKRLLTLIQQWMTAEVVEPSGKVSKPDQGTPQGGVVSPVLANIYLHHVLDLWFEKVVKPKCQGRAMLIRYCDDFVVAFQLRHDAQAFYRVLPQRLAKFNLAIAPDKTQLIRFSRFHPGKHRCFRFLGFEFYWSKDRQGEARLRCRTSTKKQHELMSSIYQWIKLNRHQRSNVLLPMLKRKLVGVANYFGLPDNSRSLIRLYRHTLHSLHKWLNRRSQRHSYNWAGLKALLGHFGIQPLRVWKRLNIVADWY
ncbi:MAG: group II intron reverse transcriptase/maturase [Gammaproteobacteria bacterium]|nr:group II intron reverse transcriptase/maturase [Gammaproteobacteria bacterium]